VVKTLKVLNLATHLALCGNGGMDPRILKVSITYKGYNKLLPRAALYLLGLPH
jgi:hypothetical protein